MMYENGGKLCTDLDDLPNLTNCKELFLDFETTSAHYQKMSVNPWHNCYIAGAAVTVDDCQKAWYVPVGHNKGGNLPWQPVYKWLEDIVSTCGVWKNHNIKYDMHVFSNGTGKEVKCKVKCTLAQAKLLNSDRFRYGLDHLSKDWLGKDISFHADRMKPYLTGNKDYGAIPADIMGHYATDDVFTGRKLDKYIDSNMPDECRLVERIEDDVTMCLYRMERAGMPINVPKVQETQMKTLQRMMEISEELDRVIGYSINPVADSDCFDLICNKHGLPVIAWTDSGNPSFDKHALRSYCNYPGAPKACLELMLEYRRLSTFNGTFLTAYLDLRCGNILHPNYNQMVRTGRMSCSLPNMQQLMPEAKELIETDDDHVIVSADYSQIEYRFIAHYIKDVDTIEAYLRNPDQDYHEWIAELCGIKRKPAKTVNFLMGFGGGKALLMSKLSVDPDVIGSIDTTDLHEFKRLAGVRAEAIYNTYHGKLPTLRTTTRTAENLCRSRGYVKNIYGRRRHLPQEVARKAFNSVVQSSAADLMKERMVELAKEFNVIGSVHDDLVMLMPRSEYTEATRCRIAEILETPSVELRLPIRVSVGAGKTWAEASENSSPVFWK